MMRAAPVLTTRALGRATLARQMLLAREAITPVDALARIAGIQAQALRPPFVGLWTRVAGFERAQLLDAVHRREIVRATTMRGTLHLVTARDYLAWRTPLQPMLDAALAGFGARLKAVDVDRLAAEARALLADGPRTFEEIRVALGASRPGADVRAMGYAVRTRLPHVHVPSNGQWGFEAEPRILPADAWLGAAPDADASPHALVRRYLAAFGPATPADAGAWSGLRGLRETFDALRPELATFRDERGRELFDLPDAPRPDADVEVSVRYLPEFDSLLLAHDDRSRVVAPEHRARLVSVNGIVAATFLVDGVVAGTWKVAVKRGTATLTLQPFVPVDRRAIRELEREGAELLRFVEPGARGQAFVVQPPG